jgi:type I restriction enzyme S subunit
MSSANFLEKLLDGVSVEWRALGEVTLPTSNIRWRDTDRTYRYIDLKSVSIETKTIAYTPEVTSRNAPSRAQKLVEKDDLIFATTRPAQQRYCLIDDEYSGEVASTGYCVLRAKKNEVLPKWILHWISSANFKTYVEENQSGSAYPAISDAKVKEFKLPIPCPENPKKSLEIQAEIVRILDAFTELTADLITELIAELTARKKQYNHYRDQLLSLKKGEVEWRTLDEITLPTSNIRWRDAERSYRYIDLTSVSRDGNAIIETIEITAQNAPSRAQKLVEKNDVIFATTRPTQQRLSLISDEYSGEIASTGYCVLRAKNNVVLPKWIYFHLSSTDFFSYVEGNQSGSAYPAISDSKVKEFKLPIPHPNDPEKSIAEQARIVAILDKFDALSKTISERLSREIELRQKQYKYYRDLLLSFPKPEEVVT